VEKVKKFLLKKKNYKKDHRSLSQKKSKKFAKVMPLMNFSMRSRMIRLFRIGLKEGSPKKKGRKKMRFGEFTADSINIIFSS
jgi:hypothetical protein